MSSEISRRGFLGGLAAAGALAAVGGLAGCKPDSSSGTSNTATASSTSGTAGSAAGTATSDTRIPHTFEYEWYKPTEGEVAYESDQVAESDIKSTIDCDVVVCGAGLSGMAASLSAAENGLKTVLLEKGSVCATRGAQIGTIGSKLQTAAGTYTIDPVEYVNDGVASMGNRVNRKIWKQFADRSGEAIDWFVEILNGSCGDWIADPSPRLVKGGVTSWPDVVMPGNGMTSIPDAFTSLASEMGIDVHFKTPAVQLVQESDASISGVIAKDDSGYIKVSASKGVILATGGYEANWEMLTQNMEPRDLAVATWLNPTTTDTGDGHMMGLAAGADIDDYPHVMMNDPGMSVKSHSMNFAISQPWLRVNEDGKRFMNESMSPEYLSAGITEQPGCHDFIIFAGTIESNLSSYISGAGLPMSVSDMASALEADVVKADTIEELAKQCGIDASNLKATIDAYNACYDKQKDTDFDKDAAYLLPVKEAPYYACEEGAGCLTTVSGLKVNEDSEVIGTDGSIIKGLYALGNVSGSMFDSYYPHHFQAISHGRCITFGYLVGRRLADKENA